MPRPKIWRTIVSVVAALALLAGGLVLCPCDTPSKASHACCESTVWRAAGGGCCGATSEAPDATPAASSPDDLFAPASSTGPVAAERAFRPAPHALASIPPVSPPRTVLRI